MSTFFSQFKEYKLPMHGVRLPSFEIDNKYKRQLYISESSTNLEFLKSKCDHELNKLIENKYITKKDLKRYQKRAKKELSILDELDFIDYILLVWSVTNYCDEQNIARGRGRGSAAGSLVLFLIGVTAIDPIKYGLYFARFVSRVRAKKKLVNGITYLDGNLMADIDLDICYYNRQKVISHLENEFEGKTSKILTLNRLTSKLLIKECGKIAAIPDEKSEEEMTGVSALIPKVYGNVADLEDTYNEVDKFKEWCDSNKGVYDIALKLRGLIKNKSVHPSAIAISHDDLEDSCPTELTSDKKSIVSSYDMNWVSLFNVKLDVLGLRGVSVVDDVCKGINIDPDKIDVTDSSIYENLQSLRAKHGLFQIEADTAFKVCKTVRPRNLEELSAVLAIARPGALQFEDTYSERRADAAIHPFFKDVLSETYGVVLYQEQLMKMANMLGFDLDEAELLRRIVGKKKVKEVKAWKKKVVELVKKHEDKAVRRKSKGKDAGGWFWEILEDSANYSFNKSHSIAYASLTAQTVYLKFKYPKEFFLSLLKMTRHEPDPISEISKIEREMSQFGIKLLRPHIAKSQYDFNIEEGNIRFGLLSIKGVSDKSLERLSSFRKNTASNKFEIFQAAAESKLNIGILSALIQAGALEGGFKQSRSQVVLEAQLWNILTKKEKERAILLADEMDYDLVNILKFLKSQPEKGGKPFIKESRWQTILNKYTPYKKIYLQNRKSENFANWYYEKNLLGYTHGKTLKDIFVQDDAGILNIFESEERPVDTRVKIISEVGKCWTGTTRNGYRYYKAIVNDETGETTAMLFDNSRFENIKRCKKENGSLPKEKNIVIVHGTKKDGVIFADRITNQDCKIYTKLSEIKNIA